jgi:tetratricopeptide (TPR) repeat protein
MMRNQLILFLFTLSASLSAVQTVWAQALPERRFIRQGNEAFQQGNYDAADVSYRRALEKAPWSYEADFNLSDVIYKQERYDEAAQQFGRLAQASADNPELQAQAYYNQGNALFKQRKLEEALEAYKNSLRANPDDQEAKFNLAYTKKLLEKDKTPDNQNQNQSQQQNPQQNPNQQPQDQPQKPQDQQQKPESRMSPEQAQQLLNAIQNNEDRTRERVDSQRTGLPVRSGKNW